MSEAEASLDVGSVADSFSEVVDDGESTTLLEGESSDSSFDDESGDEEPSASEIKDIKKEVRRLKQLTIKYNGKEHIEELPFEIEDTPEAVDWMKKQLQLAKLSQSKSQSYSQLEGEIKSFIEELRTNPRKALSNPNVGVDIKKLAADVLQEEIDNSAKSPETLEREKLEAQLKELTSERDKEKEDRRQADYERTLNQEYERYDLAMTKALEGSDLPKSPYIIKKMADYMMLGIKNGMKVEPKDVLPIVREEMQSDLKEMFAVMPADVINKLLGNETYDKVRKHRLSRAKGGKPSGKKNPATRKALKDVGAPASSSANKAEDGQTFKDFFGI